jgi:hypothetical protein
VREAKDWDWGIVLGILCLSPHRINDTPPGRWSMLHQAAHQPAIHVVKTLLNLGADPYALTPAGETADAPFITQTTLTPTLYITIDSMDKSKFHIPRWDGGRVPKAHCVVFSHTCLRPGLLVYFAEPVFIKAVTICTDLDVRAVIRNAQEENNLRESDAPAAPDPKRHKPS